MKLTEAKIFHRILSLICFPLSVLLVTRWILVPEFDIISILTGSFWPIIGFIVAVLFLKRDGYTTSASEIMFFLFILYCGIYFIIPSISMLLNPLYSDNFLVIILNFIIIGLGWCGIAYYVIY